MPYKGLRLEITDEHIAVIVMCNGESKFNMEYIRTWHRVIDDIQRNPDIKGLVTTGEGKAFSTGLDIDWMRGSDPSTLDAYHDELHRLYKRVMSLGIPTVAAINGHAIAEGAFLALVHDYRVMREDRGWIQWPEVHVKLPMTSTMLDILRLRLSSPVAHREAIVFGKRLDAKRAESLGIVDACVTEEQLMSIALQTARTALGKHMVDPTFFNIMKADVYNNYVKDEQLSAKL